MQLYKQIDLSAIKGLPSEEYVNSFLEKGWEVINMQGSTLHLIKSNRMAGDGPFPMPRPTIAPEDMPALTTTTLTDHPNLYGRNAKPPVVPTQLQETQPIASGKDGILAPSDGSYHFVVVRTMEPTKSSGKQVSGAHTHAVALRFKHLHGDNAGKIALVDYMFEPILVPIDDKATEPHTHEIGKKELADVQVLPAKFESSTADGHVHTIDLTNVLMDLGTGSTQARP